MGHSKNIENLKKTNASFDAFLTTSIGNLRKRQKAVETTFDTKIKNFYKTAKYDWAYYPFGEDEKIDFRQVDEQNLDIIKPLITKMAKNLVKGLPATLGAPAAGVAADATVAAAAAVLPEAAMVAVATVAIVELLDLLSTTTTASYSEGYVSKHIGPGLMLHMYRLSDTVEDKSIVGSVAVRESIIGYKVIYSADQEAIEGVKIMLDTLVTEMKILAKDLIRFQKGVSTLRTSASAKLMNHDMDGYHEDSDLADEMEKIHDKTDKSMRNIIKEIKNVRTSLGIT